MKKLEKIIRETESDEKKGMEDTSERKQKNGNGIEDVEREIRMRI